MERKNCIKNLLIVEDDSVISRIYSHILDKLRNDYKFDYTLAKTGQEALKAFKAQDFDAAIVNFGLPDMRGDYLAKELKKIKEVYFIWTSASGAPSEVGDTFYGWHMQIKDNLVTSESLTEILEGLGLERH